MVGRVATISASMIFLISLLAAPAGAVESHENSFSLTQKDYSFSSLRVGIRNLIETSVRNIGRQLLSDHKPNNTVNIMDYSSSKSLIVPETDQEGSWVGAPSIVKTSDNSSYLFYRLRNPFRRGWKVAVAKNKDGDLENVWEMTKYDHKDVRSLEGAALDKRNGKYSLFLSYQKEKNGKWVVTRLTAEKPSEFNFSQSEELDISFKNYPHFKDPIIYQDKLIVHAASRNFLKTTNIVATLPYNNTFTEISIGSKDYSNNRITSLIEINQTKLVFFDHKKNIVFTGEEKGRIGVLSSPKHVETLESLTLSSEHSTNSLRYVKALENGDRINFYYEAALPGKGHELRKAEISQNRFVQKLELNN